METNGQIEAHGPDAEPISPNVNQIESHTSELSRWRLSLLILSISLGLLLSLLDGTIVATSLLTIAKEFESRAEDRAVVNWVALAYVLSYLGCAVLLARVSDVIGRRNAFLASYVIFIAFSLGSGFAQNLNQLIAFRAIQGVGGSGLYSIAMTMYPEVLPKRLRSVIGGLVGIILTFSSVLGPVLGGLLTHYTTWRWIFLINGPIGAVSVLLFIITWPEPVCLPIVKRRKWKELDYIGSVLLIAATVLVVFPFQNAGNGMANWEEPIFVVPLVFGLIAWGGLLAWSLYVERRWGDSLAAAIPMRLLRNRIYALAALNTMFVGFPFLLITYGLPQRFQVVNGENSIVAGLLLLPMLGASAIGAGLAGRINVPKNRIFETLTVAAALIVLGCGLETTVSDSTSLEPKTLGFIVFTGLGFGLSVATSSYLAAVESASKDHSAAQGIIAQARVFGGSLGIAASSAILGVALEKQDNEQKAYADAFREGMVVCAIVAGVAVLLALGTYSRKRETHAAQQATTRPQPRVDGVDEKK